MPADALTAALTLRECEHQLSCPPALWTSLQWSGRWCGPQGVLWCGPQLAVLWCGPQLAMRVWQASIFFVGRVSPDALNWAILSVVLQVGLAPPA